MNVTKSQKLILTIYAGSAYSTFRDNDLLKLKNKAKRYIDKYSEKKTRVHNGGFTLMIMNNVLSGNLKYDTTEQKDAQEKILLSMAIGFELTDVLIQFKSNILRNIIRFFLAPPITDKKFADWVKKYKEELSEYIGLMNELENLKGNLDIHKIIFE